MTTHWGLATVERRSTTEQVLQELRAAIIDGRIGPRAPLREVALAEAFGTGRSAIREALSASVRRAWSSPAQPRHLGPSAVPRRRHRRLPRP